jgi:hypothetical protein
MLQCSIWPVWRVLMVLASLGLGVACQDTEEQARAAVLEAGYRFSIADYHQAAREGREVTAQFIAAGMQVDAVGARQETALQLAAAGRHHHLVSRLLAAGAEPDRADAAGVTPLMAAARAGDVASVSALTQAGASMALQDHAGRTALAAAATAGHAPVVDLLVPGTPGPLAEVLQLACAAGHTGVIDTLLKSWQPGRGPEPDWQGLLAAAARAGHLPAVRLLNSRMPEGMGAMEWRSAAADLAKQTGHLPVAAFLELEGHRAMALPGDFLPLAGEWAGSPGPSMARSVSARLTHSGEAGPQADDAGTAAAPDPQEPLAEEGTVEAGNPSPPPGRLAGQRFTKLKCDNMGSVPEVLRMVAWEPQAWPVILQDVAPGHAAAELRLTAAPPRSVTLKAGDEIPGTGCVIEKLRRRRLYTDATETHLKNVSEMHFRRVSTGETFKALAGDPVLSNDSTAVLRVAGDAREWAAVPGDEFRLGSLLLRVQSIAEGAIALENRLTRDLVKVPLSPVPSRVAP